MNTNDLRKMIEAAAEITRAAQQHEVGLHQALKAMERGEVEDWQVGDCFLPVSRALAEWRVLMAAIFPEPPEAEFGPVPDWLRDCQS
jgi:hypothetical protein